MSLSTNDMIEQNSSFKVATTGFAFSTTVSSITSSVTVSSIASSATFMADSFSKLSLLLRQQYFSQLHVLQVVGGERVFLLILKLDGELVQGHEVQAGYKGIPTHSVHEYPDQDGLSVTVNETIVQHSMGDI